MGREDLFQVSDSFGCLSEFLGRPLVLLGERGVVARRSPFRAAGSHEEFGFMGQLAALLVDGVELGSQVDPNRVDLVLRPGDGDLQVLAHGGDGSVRAVVDLPLRCLGLSKVALCCYEGEVVGAFVLSGGHADTGSA
ncbi:hypothetical protein [Kitasatospora cineracea]|uniref:hypothetical protein n=1 Tax=Kitasatospora cineracea TaxID=88074 RepID=UPI000F477FE3|nr:hypothetical protein [Kitasatospora cineracea]